MHLYPALASRLPAIVTRASARTCLSLDHFIALSTALNPAEFAPVNCIIEPIVAPEEFTAD
jgi:hypothetical protein